MDRARAAAALSAMFATAALMAQPARAATCDRACLIGTTDRYLAALAAHNPRAAPLAPNVAFVENLKRLKPG